MDKQVITQSLIDKLDDNHRVTIDQAMSTWWWNLYGGLRLTVIGYETLVAAKFEHYSFETEYLTINVPNSLLTLDRKLTCPYFIRNSRTSKKSSLILFGDREAVVMNLYGDIAKFIAAIKSNT